MTGWQAGMWTSVPGIVKAVDFATMTLSVQPAIQGRIQNEDGTFSFVNLPLLIYVPIQWPMAGGFALTLPVAINDEVLVVFSSRCIDAWWQSGGIQKPMELRMHDISDGFAIVGIKSKPNVLVNISTTEAQLRNAAGTTYVALTADNKIKLVGPVEATGNMKVTGNLEVTGTVTGGTATVPTVLGTHTHSGVTTGGGSSGPPNP